METIIRRRCNTDCYVIIIKFGGYIILGAIYGDKAGSIYEFNQTKKIVSIDPEELILPNSFYSDDTIETIAV